MEEVTKGIIYSHLEKIKNLALGFRRRVLEKTIQKYFIYLCVLLPGKLLQSISDKNYPQSAEESRNINGHSQYKKNKNGPSRFRNEKLDCLPYRCA
jgi:hypothetical protein